MVELTRLEAQIAELQLRVAHQGQTVEVEADLGSHQYREPPGARHEADRAAGAPQDPVRHGVGLGGVRADTGGARGGSAAGRPGPGDRDRGGRAPPTDLDRQHPRRRRRRACSVRRRPRRPAELRILGNWILEVRPGRLVRLMKPSSSTRGPGGRGGGDAPDRRRRARQVPRPVHDLLWGWRATPRNAPASARAAPEGTAPQSTAPPPNPDARRRTGWGRRSPNTSRLTPTEHVPHAAGVSATVVVTMTVDTLMVAEVAQLDTGHRISPGPARGSPAGPGHHLAVLGTQSQVLDLGRKLRFHIEPELYCLVLEQGGCTVRAATGDRECVNAIDDEQPFRAGWTRALRMG